MKHLIAFCLIACLPYIAEAQDTIVNPTVIGQPKTIVLQNTDVYYYPMAPPAPTDTQDSLCLMASNIFSPNGFGTVYPPYQPHTHGTTLAYWNPYDSGALGYGALWQRLFTARNQSGGLPSDIIVGDSVIDTTTMTHLGPVGQGPVIIDSLEDVDFRASGEIRMENGFYVMPGAYFHAYIEPQYDSVVFGDEFTDSAIDHSKWYVVNGNHDGYGNLQSSSDSNVRTVIDSDAHDDHALDIMLQEDTGGFFCRNLNPPDWNDNCQALLNSDTTPSRTLFSSAIIRACPWPFLSHDSSGLLTVAYNHMPYGKYEVRMKIPHTLHHANNWLYGSYEVDMDEGDPHQIVPGLLPGHQLWPSLHHAHRYGPFKGMFHIRPDSTVIFVSSDADWSLVNQPMEVFIDKVPYCVTLAPGHHKDTVIARPTGAGLMAWPAYLKYSTDSISFLYSRYADWGTTPANIADTMPWTISTDGGGNWRIFSAPYHINRSGDTQRFWKGYQPNKVTLTGYNYHGVPDSIQTYTCHWDTSINHSGDTGRIWLDQYDTSGMNLHSHTEPYTYTNDEGIFEYMGPPIPFDWSDSTPASYTYHTFGVEIEPNEVRFLYDSNVVFRIPDRLIPPGNPEYDYAAQLERSPMDLRIGEFDIDGDGYNDVLGTNPLSVTYAERMSFEHAAANIPWAGFSMVGGKPTAHYLIDYVKVWDVPKDIIVPPFPH